MPGRPSVKPDKKLLMLGIYSIYSHKKSAYKDAFPVYNCVVKTYCPPPVLNVPIVLATAVPIPVPCGV
jgi:hypothetical protein